MAENDIIVAKEGASGGLTEIALAPVDIGAAASTHSSTHHTNGADALAAHQINGQTIFSTGSATYSTDQTLTANRARQFTISNTNAGGINVTLPTGADGTLVGDTYVVIGGGTVSGPIVVRRINVLSPLIYETLATITATGQQYRFRASGGTTGGWSLVPVDTHTHAASDITSGTLDIARLPTGTGSTQVALGDHTHGNLTNDGKVGSTAGLPLKTGTAGVVEAGAFGGGAGEFAEGNHTHADLHTRSHAITSASDHTAGNHKVFYSDGSGQVQELALGSSGEVLTSNGATSPPSFAAASGGVSAVGASAADILSVSGSDLVADDPNADRLVFWDDSASKLTHLEVGSGLSISGTTITATASGGSKTYAVFTATDNQPPASNFMTLDTRNGIAVLDADDATDESAVFVGIIPEGASLGSGLKIRLHWMATSATSGNCVWDVSLERMTTDLDSDSFDTIASSGAVATNGTSGILTVTEITLTTIDSVTAGDGFRLKITRDADNGSDTMSGDAELVVCEVRSAA